MRSRFLFILLCIFLFSPSMAEGRTGYLPIRNQQDFDRLDAGLDSLCREPLDSIVVTCRPGTYFFRDGHITFSGTADRL